MIFIALIAIFIGIDYLRLQRDPGRPQPRATFSERGYQNHKAFEYISSIMSKLEMADAQVLKRYVNVNDQPPTKDIELLDLIYQNIIWQMIGDGRAGTVGNQHVDEVIYLEKLYAAVQKITGLVPGAKRELLLAAAPLT